MPRTCVFALLKSSKFRRRPMPVENPVIFTGRFQNRSDLAPSPKLGRHACYEPIPPRCDSHSQKFKEGDLRNFPNRAKGVFCPNNLYIASLVIPIIAMIPALILNFSFLVLTILLIVVGLLLFRFFVIFTKIACINCRAKNICPQAQSMFKDQTLSK